MIRKALQSRVLLALGFVIAVAVPVATLPRVPSVNPWPLVAGLVPWIFGKYVLCPLRWQAITAAVPGAPRGSRWYLRAFAESELLGLLTPGHIGSDLWRVKRLAQSGVARGDAVLNVGIDCFAGGIGGAVFVAFAARSLPGMLPLVAAGIGLVAVLGALLLRRLRPGLLPSGPMPPPRTIAVAILLSAAYQVTIAGLLLGTIVATGHTLSPFAILGAFGASQLAGIIPGVNGASPRDGALIIALVALGVPLVAAAAAVTLRATLAWLPALALGGVSLWLLRRQSVRVLPAAV